MVPAGARSPASTAPRTPLAAPRTPLAASGPGPGLVDCEPPPIMILAVQSLDCRQGLVVVRHLDEPEASTSPRLAVT
jgi:hypothetical protein